MPRAQSKQSFWNALVLLSCAAVLVGCGATSPSQYVSPRVTGRVLDMETGQPLKDVRVQRLTSDNLQTSTPAKGGHVMEAGPGVRTAADGKFMVKSIRFFGPFGSPGWYSVTLAFERNGYQSLVRSFTVAHSTNTVAGEPRVEAGDVLLPAQPNATH